MELRRRNGDSRYGQSRWLSKKGVIGEAKGIVVKTKGIANMVEDAGRRRPLADFAQGKQKRGRTVRMELDYTHQCSKALLPCK